MPSNHNEVAILKIGIVDKTFADRLLLGFMGGYEYKQTQNASTMDWVYGARYTTANTLMPQLTYEKRFKVIEGLHVSLNVTTTSASPILPIRPVVTTTGWVRVNRKAYRASCRT